MPEVKLVTIGTASQLVTGTQTVELTSPVYNYVVDQVKSLEREVTALEFEKAIPLVNINRVKIQAVVKQARSLSEQHPKRFPDNGGLNQLFDYLCDTRQTYLQV